MSAPQEFKQNPGAAPALIEHTLARLNRELPDDYLAFIQSSNGGEGFVGKKYLVLWTIENLPDWNRDYLQHTEFENSSELLLFGSNGGGEAFGFDWNANGAIVEGPMIGMERNQLLLCARNFSEFMRNPTGFKHDR